MTPIYKSTFFNKNILCLQVFYDPSNMDRELLNHPCQPLVDIGDLANTLFSNVHKNVSNSGKLKTKINYYHSMNCAYNLLQLIA